MRCKIVHIILGIVLLYPMLSYGAGNTAFQFLMIQPGARAAGMGETGTASLNDGYALYWNPAGLAKLEKTELAFTHIIYLQDMSYDFLSYIEPMSDSVVLGFGALGLFANGIPKTTEDSLGNLVTAGDTFNNSELAGIISLAWKMGDTFSMGLSAKGISQAIGSNNVSGSAIDLGALWQASDALKVGLNAQNLGSAVNDNNLPTNIKLGCAYNIPEKALNLGVEADYPLSGKLSLGIGIERTIKDFLSVRLGYNTASETAGGLSGIHLGLGFAVSQKVKVDYALAPYGDLGVVHQLSLSLKL